MKKFLAVLALFLFVAVATGWVFYKQSTAGLAPSELEAAYLTKTDRFVKIAGARVRVREEGSADAPAVLLIHGFTHSLETWDAWAKELKKTHRVVRYDILGHGLTGPDPLERYAPQERARFVGEVMDALNIPSAAIAGNSLGGLAAWRFAANNPERVDALILISPGAFPLNGAADDPAPIPTAMKAYLLAAPEAGVRISAEAIYADDSKITEKRLKVMRDMMQREGNGAAMIKSLEEFTLPDPTALLASINTPTLILWGEGDVVIPINQGREIDSIIPDSRLITYPDVGHAAQEEAPGHTVADTISFLGLIGPVQSANVE